MEGTDKVVCQGKLTLIFQRLGMDGVHEYGLEPNAYKSTIFLPTMIMKFQTQKKKRKKPAFPSFL
jgi:hypothetical protein